ncbi:hypothetical protein LPJ66_007903 [Kickxella alabastrina]|uniref:Uncharacterized protein n=1 Tax=Kickxella alabastrina TaxID=61397 RepID=A0ACC1I873_9FUNG|nr:hypothetical protein LPJ66_007903 [Kickxella alabastrina]
MPSASSIAVSVASSSSVGSNNMSALPAPPPIGAAHGNRSRSSSTASNSGGMGVSGNRVPSGFGSNIPPPSPSMQPRHLNNASPVNLGQRSNLGPGFASGTPPPQQQLSGSRPSSSHQSKMAVHNPQPLRTSASASANVSRQNTPEDLYHNVLMPTLVRLEKLTSNTQAKAAYCTLAETIRRLEHEIPGIADVFSKELTLSVNKFYQAWRE